MQRGTYVGPVDALRGKTALLQDSETDVRDVRAQFDDWSTGRSHDWWPFRRDEFELIPAVDFGDTTCDPTSST